MKSRRGRSAGSSHLSSGLADPKGRHKVQRSQKVSSKRGLDRSQKVNADDEQGKTKHARTVSAQTPNSSTANTSDEPPALSQASQPQAQELKLVSELDSASQPEAQAPQTLPALDPERSEARWEYCKRDYLAEHSESAEDSEKLSPSDAVDTLMQMTGLESVKRRMVSMYERVQLSKLQNFAFSASSYNLRCDGNPGTGKTTVARLYSAFLVELGILPKTAQMKETSGSKLLSDGVKGLEDMLEDLKAVGGGVVFVDETSQLSPATDSAGRKVLDFILPHAERMQGIYGQL
eukprot:gene16358-18666_t